MTERKEMYFKATKKQSKSYWKWSRREIIKEWDLSIDICRSSDDVIRIDCTKYKYISIDLDNKEWKFRIFVDEIQTF